ncbi:CvpA family protein [Psittacicella hinzii]|uniref:Membrane protein required for colicin V production n=1 Tax=Psittacicella hinzii TaxID=2028575 RepID=A0A3A1YSY4_9GAMM|nr:CvpA family protein [Psittacicella hinzii]RIY40606.1 hypothetical protein CKF58_00370 [Psittacicella hinzii]
MLPLIDIFLGIMALAVFARGVFRGFIGALLSLFSIVGSIIISMYYTQDLGGLLSKIPFVGSYPLIGFAIVIIVSFLILNFAAGLIGSALSSLPLFNNILLRLLGGVLMVMIFVVAVTAVYSLLQENNINISELVPRYDESYTKQVIDYINNGLQFHTYLHELVESFKQRAATMQ